jgi:riboflavin kinase / FMN adenylyltransferase
VCPTFRTDGQTIEAHLFDFAGDLYEREIEVEFVRHLRSERTFASPQALAAQLALDERDCREILARAS